MLRQLKPAEIDEMVEAYETGSTPNELATRFRVHRTTVMARLRKQGVVIRTPRPVGLRSEDAEVAVVLYREGWSLAQLGERFGVSSPTVALALRKRGVVIRPAGRHTPD